MQVYLREILLPNRTESAIVQRWRKEAEGKAIRAVSRAEWNGDESPNTQPRLGAQTIALLAWRAWGLAVPRFELYLAPWLESEFEPGGLSRDGLGLVGRRHNLQVRVAPTPLVSLTVCLP